MFQIAPKKGYLTSARLFTSCCFVLTILFCTDDYNPFKDPSNARMFISGSFGDGDTIVLFSTETLSVVIGVPGLADSFSVTASANRLFDGGSRIITDAVNGALGNGPFRFFISMYDTGRQEIRFVLRRTDGEITATTISCYVRMPLLPHVVTGSYGAEVSLITEGVKDRDVIYKWDFGRGTVITTTRPETTAVLYTSGTEHYGLLKVTDGYVESPPVSFDYALFDSIGPIIDLLEELYLVSGDTIVTPDTLFFFRVVIKDRGTGGVDSASINGKPFDLVDDSLYTTIINRMDTVSTSLRMTLFAIDNFQYYNDTSVTFHIRFDPGARPLSGLRLFLWVPPQDSTVFTARTKNLLGTIEHVAGDAIDTRLLITVNGEEVYDDTLVGKGSVDWVAPVTFSDSVNVLVIKAFNHQGDSLAGLQRLVRVQTASEDTAPPVIVAVLVGGEHANGLSVAASTVRMRVLAFDAAGEIERVEINGSELSSDNGVVWERTVALTHQNSGNVFRIKVTDLKSTEFSVKILCLLIVLQYPFSAESVQL
ncbi:MAG: hypothetical protein JW863_18440, partial [Chitinispirillaceae bacterium]|nr:hypothetical protein [Chitinispirillaceae bacterium]